MANLNVTNDGRASRGVQLDSGNNVGRASARNDFGTHLSNGVARGAGVAAAAVGVAAPMVPGGAVLAAAASGAAGSMGGGAYGSGGGVAGAQNVGADGLPIGGSLLNTPQGGTGGAGGSAPGSQQDLLNQTKGMQEMAQSFNLQYLQLQEKMQSENRSFSTVSNVMKTKHDTAKSSISNVR
jgi:hypothetical protein